MRQPVSGFIIAGGSRVNLDPDGVVAKIERILKSTVSYSDPNFYLALEFEFKSSTRKNNGEI